MNLEKDARKVFQQLRKMRQLQSVKHRQIIGEPVYDVARGEETQEYNTSLPIDAYITGYSTSELSDSIRITDSRCVMLKEDLKIIPEIDDTITYLNKRYFVISKLGENDANPAVELQLRGAS